MISEDARHAATMAARFAWNTEQRDEMLPRERHRGLLLKREKLAKPAVVLA